MLLRSLRLSALACAAAFVACSPNPNTGDDGGSSGLDGGGGGNDGGQNNGPCPAGVNGSLSVCQLQNEQAPGHPQAGEDATVRGVVVTSPMFSIGSAGTLQGMFVSDAAGGAWSGVLVTFATDSGLGASLGDVVDVTGTMDEFSSGSIGTETRLKATSMQAIGGTGTVAPTVVADPSVLADETTGEAYEGVLVQVESVSTTELMSFGQFAVTGGLIVDDPIFHYGSVAGEVFTTLTGVMGYSAFEDGGPRLYPRFAEDVVAVALDFDARLISDLRDPAATDYVAECDFSMDCTPYKLEKVVVVSPLIVEDKDDATNTPYLFGFYVADPEAVDGNGRLTPYSGIKITVAPNSNELRTNSYTFGENPDGGTFPYPDDMAAGDAPAVGDVLNVVGQNKPYFDEARVADVVVLEKLGTVDDTGLGVTMPLPAQFDSSLGASDARNPARLKGGRPAITSPASLVTAEDPADPAIESWEGVLVELVDVDTTDECADDKYNPGGFTSADDDAYLRDFGYFKVTGDVEIGTVFYQSQPFGGFWRSTVTASDQICANAGRFDVNASTQKCEDSRLNGQTFTSLTGIVNYSFSVHRVNPRDSADIAPSSLYSAADSGNCQ